MAKQTNMWVYVIIALIVGVLIGYAAAGGFKAGGKAFFRSAPIAISTGEGGGGSCSGAGNQATYCSQIKDKDSCEGSGVCTWTESTTTPTS